MVLVYGIYRKQEPPSLLRLARGSAGRPRILRTATLRPARLSNQSEAGPLNSRGSYMSLPQNLQTM